jgi:hypothetical protein
VPWNEEHPLAAEVRRWWKKEAPREWERVEEFRRKAGWEY